MPNIVTHFSSGMPQNFIFEQKRRRFIFFLGASFCFNKNQTESTWINVSFPYNIWIQGRNYYQITSRASLSFFLSSKNKAPCLLILYENQEVFSYIYNLVICLIISLTTTLYWFYLYKLLVSSFQQFFPFFYGKPL